VVAASGEGDYLLLCTDGLTNTVKAAELQSVIADVGADIERTCREAIDLANRKGGRDNITRRSGLSRLRELGDR